MKKLFGLGLVSAFMLTACGTTPREEVASQASPNEMQSIVDTAKSSGQFETLLTALAKADLTDTLSGPGPFTVFAPTDEAFAKVPADALGALLDDVSALTNVLLYHVTNGERLAADVLAQNSLPMLNGSEAVVSSAEDVTIAGAKIVTTDIRATNGVIHVISEVIFP